MEKIISPFKAPFMNDATEMTLRPCGIRRRMLFYIQELIYYKSKMTLCTAQKLLKHNENSFFLPCHIILFHVISANQINKHMPNFLLLLYSFLE